MKCRGYKRGKVTPPPPPLRRPPCTEGENYIRRTTRKHGEPLTGVECHMPPGYGNNNDLGDYSLQNEFIFARLDRTLPIFKYFQGCSNPDLITLCIGWWLPFSQSSPPFIAILTILLRFTTVFPARRPPSSRPFSENMPWLTLLCSGPSLEARTWGPALGRFCSVTPGEDKWEDSFSFTSLTLTSLKTWLSILIKIRPGKTAALFVCFTKPGKYFICSEEAEGPSKLCRAICFRN